MWQIRLERFLEVAQLELASADAALSAALWTSVVERPRSKAAEADVANATAREAQASIAALKDLETLLDIAPPRAKADLPFAVARQVAMLRRHLAGEPRNATRREAMRALEAEIEAALADVGGCTAARADCASSDALLSRVEVEQVLATNRTWDVLLNTWLFYHESLAESPLRALVARLVAESNAGARDHGFADTGELWRTDFEMPADAFERTLAVVWADVQPLFTLLHCHVRARLALEHGADRVGAARQTPIPAHVLGSVLADDWSPVYDLVMPFPNATDERDQVDAAFERLFQSANVTNVTDASSSNGAWHDNLTAQESMHRDVSAFFASLGLEPLPASFWSRSRFSALDHASSTPLPASSRKLPRCDPSAWDLGNDDLRVSMCTRLPLTYSEWMAAHREHALLEYSHAYRAQPFLFRRGANAAFRNAVAAAAALSASSTAWLSTRPWLLAGNGTDSTMPAAPTVGDSGATAAELNAQMRLALSTLPFMAHALATDAWYWRVMANDVDASEQQSLWWRLRVAYEGVAAPAPSRNHSAFSQTTGTSSASATPSERLDALADRSVTDHRPAAVGFAAELIANTLHAALCSVESQANASPLSAPVDASMPSNARSVLDSISSAKTSASSLASPPPLHRCSIGGSRAAGARLAALMRTGASVPWQSTLHEATAGTDFATGAPGEERIRRDGTYALNAKALLAYFEPLRKWLQVCWLFVWLLCSFHAVFAHLIDDFFNSRSSCRIKRPIKPAAGRAQSLCPCRQLRHPRRSRPRRCLRHSMLPCFRMQRWDWRPEQCALRLQPLCGGKSCGLTAAVRLSIGIPILV